MGLYYLSSVGQLGYTLYPLAKHQDKMAALPAKDEESKKTEDNPPA